MKRIILMLTLAITVVGVSAQSRSEQRKIEKMARQAATTLRVDSLIRVEQFTFVAQRAITSLPDMPYVTLSGVNDLILEQGKLTSRLPFYGSLYSAPIGVTDSPLSLTSDDFSVSVLTNKLGKNLLKIVLHKSSSPLPNNSITMVIEIFADSTAVLNITMANGSPSMFYGYIEQNK